MLAQRHPNPGTATGSTNGGTTSPVRNSITELAVVTVATEGERPPPLVGASTTTVGTRLYVFAGRLTEPRILTNDLFVLDLTTHVWRKVRLQLDRVSGLSTDASVGDAIHNHIRPRYFHSAVVYGRRIVYFGGMGLLRANTHEVGVLNDVLILDTETMRFSVPRMTTGLPPPRYAHLATLIDRDRMLVLGGQDVGTEYMGDLHVLDLTTMGWCVSRKLDRNVGIYRSVVANDPHHERIIVYSNHNFGDVTRSLHVLSEPNWRLSDRSEAMSGPQLPPGLRFPTAARLGHHLLVSGTYMGREPAAFKVWALDLRSYVWQEINCGPLFEKGSWNRGVLCDSFNRFYVFGHTDRDLLHDYNSRQLNFDHLRIIHLEAFGLFRPSSPVLPMAAQELGLALFDQPTFADVEILSTEGLLLAVNSTLLRQRWPRMAEALASATATTGASDLTARPLLCVPEAHDTLYQFARYLYTRALDVGCSTKLLADLMGLADRNQLPELKDLCSLELHQRLALDTSPLIFEGAIRANHRGLHVRSLLYMFDRREALLRKHMLILQDLHDDTQRQILAYFPEINKHYRKRSYTNSSQNSSFSHFASQSNASLASRRSQELGPGSVATSAPAAVALNGSAGGYSGEITDRPGSLGVIPIPIGVSAHRAQSAGALDLSTGSEVGGHLGHSYGSSAGSLLNGMSGHNAHGAPALSPIQEAASPLPSPHAAPNVPILKHSASHAQLSSGGSHASSAASIRSGSGRLEHRSPQLTALDIVTGKEPKSPRQKTRLLKLSLGNMSPAFSGSNGAVPGSAGGSGNHAAGQSPSPSSMPLNSNGTFGRGSIASQPDTPSSATSMGSATFGGYSAASLANSLKRPFLRVVGGGTGGHSHRRSDRSPDLFSPAPLPSPMVPGNHHPFGVTGSARPYSPISPPSQHYTASPPPPSSTKKSFMQSFRSFSQGASASASASDLDIAGRTSSPLHHTQPAVAVTVGNQASNSATHMERATTPPAPGHPTTPP
ncbi:hypothetical protein IWQ60_009941 [Tieghemiomyces parasiticus]|uniref:BTB domain-containing protein n=1 Tax=Tieghemiomyces parasiticus TaxID=78921 RepID=A0A9W8DNP7_9FUNG|nr:hypothetical protein IWQ60_009941 [Tieghemiomyces parasiticus]